MWLDYLLLHQPSYIKIQITLFHVDLIIFLHNFYHPFNRHGCDFMTMTPIIVSAANNELMMASSVASIVAFNIVRKY